MFKEKKNLLIIFLVIIVISMMSGYASLAQVLKIQNSSNLTANWTVEIIDVKIKKQFDTKELKPVKFDATAVDFNVELNHSGSYITYTIYVENKGNIDAVLDSVAGLEEANNRSAYEIKYKLNNSTKELRKKSIVAVDFTIMWSDKYKSVSKSLEKVATINLNYIQDID